MKDAGQGIGFGCICLAAAWLEVSGSNASGLWFLIVVWALVSYID